MPKTITLTVYEFEELNAKAKEKARDWFRSASMDDQWYENVYEDAKEIGIKITSFDTGRGNCIEGEFIWTPLEIIRKIKSDHGPLTDTYIMAMRHEPFVCAAYDENSSKYGNSSAVHEFKADILEKYLQMLRKELDYIESDEYVDEGILTNGYTFTESGKREG